jgi:type III pantothenate kinase
MFYSFELVFLIFLKIESMNVVVDIGNTRVKLALFEHGILLEEMNSMDFDANFWRKIILKFPDISSVIISSTRKTQDFGFISEDFFKLILNSDTPLPISINYNTPETLGRDRIAAAVGSYLLFPSKATLVIDAGTCITYEYLDAKGVYQGGGISPGLQMRLDAMHHFTGNLPELSMIEGDVALLGKDTNSAMYSGAKNGLIAEIEGLIAEYKSQFGVEVVVLTGGDAQGFEKQVKNTIFAAPQLVLMGLNHILEHNVKML